MFRRCFGSYRGKYELSGRVSRLGLGVSARHFSDHFVILDGLAEPVPVHEDIHHDKHTVALIGLPLA
jgi:hypothetical protein